MCFLPLGYDLQICQTICNVNIGYGLASTLVLLSELYFTTDEMVLTRHSGTKRIFL